ncbi:phosphopantetheine-binding protein [Micromonospora sp. KLBMP9576]|uniref:phosphopantetheine-binding protein n=1 Tax=Micromonospora sp. KLBMP9576 TaxID=3424769 RepID=UPI003D90DCE6
MSAPSPEVVPRAEKDLSCDYRAPSTEVEHTLVRMWRQHLNVEPIGVDDDFFELGGHSLLAADLLVATEDAVGVRVPARTLYLQPTIAELAEAIDRLRGQAAPA